jgi:hypothetical protein
VRFDEADRSRDFLATAQMSVDDGELRRSGGRRDANLEQAEAALQLIHELDQIVG